MRWTAESKKILLAVLIVLSGIFFNQYGLPGADVVEETLRDVIRVDTDAETTLPLATSQQSTTTSALDTVASSHDVIPGVRATAVRVIDGDTILLLMNGIEERVRLIGIDTPESVAPNQPIECFGREATAYAKKLMEGKQVLFAPDETQDTRDKYGRLLGYVFLPDNRNVGLILISEGYAYEYTYDRPYRFQSEFKAAHIDAKRNQRGLWATDACREWVQENQ